MKKKSIQKCKHCGFKFKNLKLHIKQCTIYSPYILYNKRSIAVSFVCLICTKWYYKRADIHKHLKHIHKIFPEGENHERIFDTKNFSKRCPRCFKVWLEINRRNFAVHDLKCFLNDLDGIDKQNEVIRDLKMKKIMEQSVDDANRVSHVRKIILKFVV